MVWNFTYTTLVIKLTCHSDQFFHFSHSEEFQGFEIFKAFLDTCTSRGFSFTSCSASSMLIVDASGTVGSSDDAGRIT